MVPKDDQTLGVTREHLMRNKFTIESANGVIVTGVENGCDETC